MQEKVAALQFKEAPVCIFYLVNHGLGQGKLDPGISAFEWKALESWNFLICRQIILYTTSGQLFCYKAPQNLVGIVNIWAALVL